MPQLFLWIGYVLTFFGGLWIIVLAWQKGVFWGVGCLFFPLLQFVYVARNWKESKSAFCLLIGGFAALLLSAVFGG